MNHESPFFGFQAAVVEDDPAQLGLYRRELKHLGFSFHGYFNAAGLITDLVAARVEPDVIISDYYMQDMYGSGLAREIRDIPFFSPIVVISAIYLDQMQKQMANISNIHFLEKPLLIGELENTLRKILLP